MTLVQFNALVEQYNQVQEVLNFRTGLICAVIANVNRDPKKRRRAFKPRDFMPGKKSQQGKLPTIDELRMMNIAAGGEDVFFEKKTKELSQEELKRIVTNIQRTGKVNGK